jgi:hypothetical protein
VALFYLVFQLNKWHTILEAYERCMKFHATDRRTATDLVNLLKRQPVEHQPVQVKAADKYITENGQQTSHISKCSVLCKLDGLGANTLLGRVQGTWTPIS